MPLFISPKGDVYNEFERKPQTESQALNYISSHPGDC